MNTISRTMTDGHDLCPFSRAVCLEMLLPPPPKKKNLVGGGRDLMGLMSLLRFSNWL